MMMNSLDRKRSGFFAGSKTVDEDWKDWNSPVMSRDRAKLLRNKTYKEKLLTVHENQKIHTKLEIAVLNRTSRASSWSDRSIL
jgi:hypothetical protein